MGRYELSGTGNARLLPRVRAVGETVFETTNVEPHELRAYEVLRAHGHSFTVKAVDPAARARGLSSLDLEMYGSMWELKCPRGSNARKTISRNINKAVLQAEHAAPAIANVRIVLSALEVKLDSDEIIYAVEAKMREGKIDELILILSELDVRYYKREAEIPIALLVQMGGCLRTVDSTITALPAKPARPHEKAEIPIALLSQTGGCLRAVDSTITAEVAEGHVLVLFSSSRVVRRAVRYEAVKVGSGQPQRRGRSSRRREARRC